MRNSRPPRRSPSQVAAASTDQGGCDFPPRQQIDVGAGAEDDDRAGRERQPRHHARDVPCGSLSRTAIIIIGSAAVSDQTIASCCASRMFEPSEPVPSIRLPKNRNAMMKSGIASASATHGISTCDAMSSGTMPMPAGEHQQQPDGDLQQSRGAEAEQLAGENLVGIGRGQQHLDDLVLLLGGGALHQISGGHQHRHQEQHREDERHRDADDAAACAAVA